MHQIVDHALATAELGLPIFPLRPMAKTPIKVAWKEEATTDPNQILAWWNENPRYNYGVKCGDEADLFVIDIDSDAADSWWRGHGFPEGAVVMTPNGGRHIYYRSEGADVQTNASSEKLFKGFDVRGSGGYVVGPGSMLPSGTYRGTLAHIPMAVPELIEFLPARQTYTTVERDGEKVEAASENELRQIASAVEAMQTLPRQWHEGAGWRTTVYRVACWFSRMVNSPDYAMTENGALQIILEHMPTDREWGEQQIMAQWESARRSTVGQFADIPEAPTPSLIPFLDAQAGLPEMTSFDESFHSLLFSACPPDEAYRRRRTILVEALRAGLGVGVAGSIVWGSTAATPLMAHPGGLAELWKEAEAARASVSAESGEGIEPAPADSRPALDPDKKREVLLTPNERELVATFQWWGTRYLEWAAGRVALYNPPYHRMNLWTILSLVYSTDGFIPEPARRIGLNLFQMLLGRSTTGKSESMHLASSVIDAYFPADDNPDIGGNASPNALIETLIARDGKPSWFNTDEAHGILKQMAQEGGFMAGLKELITKLYDGKVGAMQRVSKKELSGKRATTFFNFYLMGTVKELSEVLDPSFWTSGLGPRFIWANGMDIEPEEDTFDARQVESYTVEAYDEMPKQWASEFHAMRTKLKSHGTLPLAILHDKDALDRQSVVQRRLMKVAAGHRYEDLLKPTMMRLGINIRKAACLVAMSEGAPRVSLRHQLIAIEAGEEWLNTALLMVELTTANEHSRAVDEVERFIAGSRGKRIALSRVYRQFRDRRYRDVDEQIQQLVREGRITKKQTGVGDGAYELEIKE